MDTEDRDRERRLEDPINAMSLEPGVVISAVLRVATLLL
jgi:hypothetical protein